jgi:hypothetical protein
LHGGPVLVAFKRSEDLLEAKDTAEEFGSDANFLQEPTLELARAYAGFGDKPVHRNAPSRSNDFCCNGRNQRTTPVVSQSPGEQLFNGRHSLL